MVFIGEVMELSDFNFGFWMEMEILSEVFKGLLLNIYCYHVARKKQDPDEEFEMIEPQIHRRSSSQVKDSPTNTRISSFNLNVHE